MLTHKFFNSQIYILLNSKYSKEKNLLNKKKFYKFKIIIFNK